MPQRATLPVLSTLATLTDELIELRLIRALQAGDLNARPPEAQFLSHVPEYRFSIHRRSDGLRVGRIHLRITNDEDIAHAVGHTGYAVDELHRRNGYAAHALTLIITLAGSCHIAPLWVLIEPDNTASRKTAERAGFQLMDIAETQLEAISLGIGKRVCRYVIDKT